MIKHFLKVVSGNFYYRMKIRDKFILSYLLLFGLWSYFFIFYTYEKSVDILQDQMKTSISVTQEQVQLHLTYKFQEMSHLSNTILTNYNLQKILREETENKNRIQQLEDYYDLKEVLRNLQTSYSPYQIQLYLRNSTFYTEERIHFFPEYFIQNEWWFRDVVAKKGGGLWIKDSTFDETYDQRSQMVSMVRLWKDPNSQSRIGILKINASERDIRLQLEKMNIDNIGTTYLVDHNGNVISSNGDYDRGKIPIEIVHHISDIPTQGIMTINVENEKQMIVYKELDQVNWSLVTIVSYQGIIEESAKVRNNNLIITFVLIMISVVLSIFFSNHFSKRVHNLSQRMMLIDQENIGQLMELKHQDEFSKIERKYNEMVIKIRNLIEDVYKAEAKKKEADLRALQAQINPHFLYNTLDTINWMAVEKEAYDISKMVSNLGRFFRLLLSGGKDIVSVEEEMGIVKHYLSIQQIRFNHSIEVNYQVSDELLKYAAVKLTLQPIVENAIKHGVQNNKNKRGRISIIGEKIDNNIHIKVIDNGKPFSLQQNDASMDSIFQSGYGLKNVKERLHIYFGQSCSVDLYRTKQGTIVELIWPAREMGN
jgi:two-component system sensor histidine kinase YesM